jgi:flavin-dependent dehydrogenase
MKKVAVVGGGIFGATAAIHAARIGHDVHLFEKQDDLLQAASRINQYRLHRGYHYPRSSDTARSCRDAEYSFREEYGDAIISDCPHLYGIARERSKTSFETFLAFCDANALEYRMVKVPELINSDAADVVEVVEQSFDFAILLSSVRKKLFDTVVQVHLATRVDNSIMDRFDKIVLATYASTNDFLSKMGGAAEEY